MPINSKQKELLTFAGIGAVLLFIYHFVVSSYFPAEGNLLGHDYSYYMPHLLDGYYWYLNNGFFSTKWFTPAFCGGVPAFPNPQNIYYSIPQWLTFFTDPLNAIYITLLIFAALGYGGFYALLRNGFKLSISAAILGAALFLFNGFYTTRMLIGHLTFHAFMLTPLIAFLLLYKPTQPPKKPILFALIPISICALLFSYFIYSGMIHLVIPVILILMFLGILHGLLYGHSKAFWIKLIVSGLIGILIAMPKMAAALSFVGNFERDLYPLPGAATIWGLLKMVFTDLFLTPTANTAGEVMTNIQWTLTTHEMIYSVTIVPLLIILIGCGLWIYRKNTRQHSPISIAQWSCIAGLVLILIIPLAINYYQPAWNALLKQTPIFKSSSTLVRWFCIYIPIVILAAAIFFDRFKLPEKIRPYAAAVAIGIVTVSFIIYDHKYFYIINYNAGTITDAYYKAKKSGKPPTIGRIFMHTTEQGQLYAPLNRNDVLTKGYSQLYCYEPIFGYRLEKFPAEPLKLGLVNKRLEGGIFNIKNPACFVYPEANNCKPGTHFTHSQADEAEAFVYYKPFDFAMPWWQKAANTLAVVTLLFILVFWISYPLFIRYINKQTK